MGTTTSEKTLKQRLSNLQSGNPHQLLLFKKFKVTDGVAAENSAKKALLEYKANLGGGTEWYAGLDDSTIEETVGDALQKYRVDEVNSQTARPPRRG